MGTKFKKNNWRAEPIEDSADNIIINEDGNEIAVVYGTQKNVIKEGEANARLISAAPDLFAACIKQAALMDEAGMIDEDLIKAIQKAIEEE